MDIDGEYQNTWINDNTFLYYLMKPKNLIKTNISTGLNKMLVDEVKKVHFFETVSREGRNIYIYRGIVEKKDIKYIDNQVALIYKLNSNNETKIVSNNKNTNKLTSPSFVEFRFDDTGGQLDSEDGKILAINKVNRGILSEELAVSYFLNKGYNVDVVNYSGYDLVISKNNRIEFVEVKTLTDYSFYISYKQLVALKEKRILLCLVDSQVDSNNVYLSNTSDSTFLDLIDLALVKAKQVNRYLEKIQNNNIQFDSYDIKILVTKPMLSLSFNK